MKIAIYSRGIKDNQHQDIVQLLDELAASNVEPVFYQDFFNQFYSSINIKTKYSTFNSSSDLDDSFDCIMSLGGDEPIPFKECTSCTEWYARIQEGSHLDDEVRVSQCSRAGSCVCRRTSHGNTMLHNGLDMIKVLLTLLDDVKVAPPSSW